MSKSNLINIVTIIFFIFLGYLSYNKNFELIGILIYFSTLIAFTYSFFKKKPAIFTTFIFSLSPLILIFKNYAIAYNFPSYILIANLFLYLIISTGNSLKNIRERAHLHILIYILLFVIIGLIKGVDLIVFTKYTCSCSHCFLSLFLIE